MAQSPQARSASTGSRTQAHGVTHGEKPASQEAMRQGATLLRDKEDVGQGGIAEGDPHSAIAAERDDGGGMQRDPPGFVKFSLADVQDRRSDIQVHVLHREADGFAYPE